MSRFCNLTQNKLQIKMKHPTIQLILLLTFFILSSCATYKTHITDSATNWKENNTPTEKPIHSVFLVGDAGNAQLGESTPALTLLKSHLEKANENSSVIFLGDNIYPVGMPPKSKKNDREIAEHRLNAQLDLLKKFKGRPIFLPGNHDWYRYGIKGLHRQEKYIEKKLNAGIEDEDDWENYFLPDDGCSGPNVIEVNEKLVIIVIDSNWFVLNWDKYPNINSGCDIKTREGFALAFLDALKKNRNKNILIAMHHPLKSNGIHGGHNTLRSHFFPGPGKAKNIPLPVLGTVYNILRSTIGSRQDIASGIYKELNSIIVPPAKDLGEFVIAAGHEHSLQYFDDSNSNQNFIVSGSGSKHSATASGDGLTFGVGKQGFSKVDYYKDGSAWVEFWTVNESGTGELAFRSKMKGAFEQQEDDIPTKFPIYDSRQSSVTKTPTLDGTNKVNNFHKKIMGSHYRDIYNTEYAFPTLDMETFKGGLEVIQRGGGMQTNSLRLKNPDGRQYVMRALTKDESRLLPYPFNRMKFISYILKDFFLSSHPFGPLAVPTLADACKVYHTNPNYYYIPKQPRLGVNNDIFGNEVYLVEERVGGDWENLESFGFPDKLISSVDVAKKMRKNHKHHIDENWVIRSRIFDLMIGDWDRHDDQWRWKVTKDKDDDGHKVYQPIPRDRDQAFAKYDGALIGMLRPLVPNLRQMAIYKNKMPNMKWVAYNTRWFDHYFLTEKDLSEWKKEAAFIQANLTDEIIDQAFLKMPKKAQELSAEKIKAVLRYRRDHLHEIAEAYYYQVSKKVAVVGTDKRDFFEVIRKDFNHTQVKMYALSKKGNKGELLYDRTFLNSVTQEVFLYGLDGDDDFHVSGKVKKGLVVRIVGGVGDDKIIDESKVSGVSKKTKIYDSKDGNEIDFGTEGKNYTSNITTNNIYDRKGTQFDETLKVPLPILGVNQDNGLLIGFSETRTKAGFHKSPYGAKYERSFDYAFATQSFRGNFNYEFIDRVKKWDIVTNGKLEIGRYAFNFYGLGNESATPSNDLDFYRVRNTTTYLDIGLQRRFAANFGRFSIRPLYQHNNVNNTEGRFITSNESGIDNNELSRQSHLGIISEIDFYNVDNLASPKKGAGFTAYFNPFWSWLENGDQPGISNSTFTKMGSNLVFYLSTKNKSKLTLATKLGIEKVSGNAPFYFAPTIGQLTGLRGFRPFRFRGTSSYYQMTDLRWELFSPRNVGVPFSLGIFGAIDYGRVWLEEENSDQWHNSYGGGIWIAPLDFFVLSIGLHHSIEENLFQFRVGHDF